MQLTVSEALAALKRTAAKVNEKRKAVREAAIRPAIMVDPHAESGGSRSYIQSQLQAIQDIGLRHMAIRSAIGLSNFSTMLTINGRARSIGDWLVWRREIVEPQKAVLLELVGAIEQLRRQGGQFRDSSGANPVDAEVCIDEAKLRAELANIEEVLGELDGLLSKLNATTVIDVPDAVA